MWMIQQFWAAYRKSYFNGNFRTIGSGSMFGRGFDADISDNVG